MMMWWTNERYRKPPSRWQRDSALNSYVMCINIALLCASLAMLLGSIFILRRRERDLHEAWDMLHTPSPMTEYLNLSPDVRTLRLDLEQNADNIYIRPPSKETDDAWNNLERGVASWATSSDLAAAGIDPSKSVRLPATMGHGEDAYPIIVDVKHRIHCLNRLRKDIYFDHYYGSDFSNANATRFHTLHTEHCILVLLKSMMCDANTDFDAFSWFRHFPHSMADFNINRKCGDFEGIDRWASERQLDQKELFNMPKPGNVFERPMSDWIRRTLAEYDSHGIGGDIN